MDGRQHRRSVSRRMSANLLPWTTGAFMVTDLVWEGDTGEGARDFYRTILNPDAFAMNNMP